MNIKEKIKEFLEAETQQKIESDQVDLIKNGFLDSFVMIRLINFIETELGGQIDMEEISPNNFNSVESIVLTVKKHGDQTY